MKLKEPQKSAITNENTVQCRRCRSIRCWVCTPWTRGGLHASVWHSARVRCAARHASMDGTMQRFPSLGLHCLSSLSYGRNHRLSVTRVSSKDCELLALNYPSNVCKRSFLSEMHAQRSRVLSLIHKQHQHATHCRQLMCGQNAFGCSMHKECMYYSLVPKHRQAPELA